MSRKDYILIARALRYAYKDDAPVSSPFGANIREHQRTVIMAASRIAIELEGNNPHFNREHFLAVVRGEKDLNSRPARR
jgi:hypothetical protein